MSNRESPMPDTQVRPPSACSTPDLSRFEAMVRAGFGGSRPTLPSRIRRAAVLGFLRQSSDGLVAIAGLKRPGRRYVERLFRDAGELPVPEPRPLELGWVFVVPSQRGRGFGRGLCRVLLQWAQGDPVYATTRTENLPMRRILESLEMTPAHRPVTIRGRSHLLYLAGPGRGRGEGDGR